MRSSPALVACALVAAACGTPVGSEGTSDAGATTSTPLASETTVGTSANTETQAGSRFDTDAMDRLFPPDRASLVLWGVLRPGGVDITARIRIDGPTALVFDESIELTASEGTQQLLADIDVEPERVYSVSVTINQDTTDTTNGQEVTPLDCETEITPTAGSAWAITIVPNKVCWQPTVVQWRTVGGVPLSPEEISELAGPSHCDWESVVFLHLDSDYSTAYARDESRTFDSSFYTPGGLGQGGSDTTDDTMGTTGTSAYTGEPLSFAFLDKLPVDAIDSGHRNSGRELWQSDSGDYVYMRSASGVERWPLISPVPLCFRVG